MRVIPDLIFCAAGNRRFSEIARDAGFLLGARLPGTVYLTPLYFADQDYKNPTRSAYMAALKKYRPIMASVLDWEREGQLSEVISWAEEASQYVEIIMIIPKIFDGIELVPRTINGKAIRLGFSVPTTHGGTSIPEWRFSGWPIHLLGGSPAAQMRIANYLDVRSVDGNMMMKMANQFCAFWKLGRGPFSNSWQTIIKSDGVKWTGDAHYEAFRRSCNNIMDAWHDI